MGTTRRNAWTKIRYFDVCYLFLFCEKKNLNLLFKLYIVHLIFNRERKQNVFFFSVNDEVINCAL